MINTYTYDNETWIDIDHGTAEEIRGIIEKYTIHPFVAKELTSTTRKPRIEFHNGYVYCILHFPAIKHSHGDDRNQEVDFILGKNLLITARYDTIDSLYNYSKTLEVKEVIETQSERGQQTIFLGLLRELYSGLFDELAAIEDQIDAIQHHIFLGRERDMVFSISETIRTLLDFKRTTELHHEVLESLKRHGEHLFGEQFVSNLEVIILDYLKMGGTIRSHIEMLHELRDTNDSLLTTKQNEIFRTLTIITFLMLPVTAIGSIFSMNIHFMPLTYNIMGFPIILVIMLAAVCTALAYLMYKKWI